MTAAQRRRIRNRPEQEQQIALFRWAALAMAAEPRLYARLAYMTHVPNGGARSKVEGSILKAMGVRRGVPDVLLFCDGELSQHGLAFEFKAPGGASETEDQARWLAYLSAMGWRVHVVRDWTVARDLIRRHLGVSS